MTGHRPGDDRSVALADQEAERAARAKHLGDRGEGRCGVVDVLEDTVAEHHVDAARSDHLEQAGGVTLVAGDPIGDPAFLGAAAECGQSIGAGVDHDHLVSELGDPDGEPAGAAADVEDVECT